MFTSTTALNEYATQLSDSAAWITEGTRTEPRTIYHKTIFEAEQIVNESATAAMRIRIDRMSRCFPGTPPIMGVYRLYHGVDVRMLFLLAFIDVTPYRRLDNVIFVQIEKKH